MAAIQFIMDNQAGDLPGKFIENPEGVVPGAVVVSVDLEVDTQSGELFCPLLNDGADYIPA
jgi:hypothetical protein